MNTICIGHGIDSVSIGLLAVAILSALVGFVVWVRPTGDPQRGLHVANFVALTAVDICYCST